jgi:hypothetical protein
MLLVAAFEVPGLTPLDPLPEGDPSAKKEGIQRLGGLPLHGGRHVAVQIQGHGPVSFRKEPG